MHLALTDLFHAKWTNAIHDEWIRNVLKSRPDIDAAKLERTRTLMNAHVIDALVVGYEGLIPSLALPDPDDRHVLAAAVACGADVVLTFNLRDFPATALATLGIEARHPDDFIPPLVIQSPDVVCTAARRQRASLKNPPKSVDEYFQVLENQGLRRTVAELRPYADQI